MNNKYKNVYMFVFNNFTHDSRVLKEAVTLSNSGYNVEIVAFLDPVTESSENVGGIHVHRLNINPFHLRILGWIKKTTNRIYQKIDSSMRVHGSSINNLCLRFSEWLKKTITTKDNNVVNYSDIARSNTIPFHLKYLKRIRIEIRKLVVLFLSVFHRFIIIVTFNFRLYEYTKDKDICIVHSHDLNTMIGAFCIKHKTNCKLVYDSHELYLDRNRFRKYSFLHKKVMFFLEKKLIKRSDLVITVNDSIADILADRYHIPKPLVVMNIPNKIVKSSQFHIKPFRETFAIPIRSHVLLYSGAITVNRGLANLITSLTLMPDCHLVLMGYSTDSFKQQLVDISEVEGVLERVHFHSAVAGDQVPYYASTADIGVAPIENVCLSYFYCSPNKIFEYLIAGIPVVASNFPEMSRVINELDIGSTFDPSDPIDIARSVKEVLYNNKRYHEMKERAKHACQHYNWGNEGTKLLNGYKMLSE